MVLGVGRKSGKPWTTPNNWRSHSIRKIQFRGESDSIWADNGAEAALVLFLLQGIYLIYLSVREINHFQVGIDFAFYYQALSRIVGGDLSPYSTIFPHGFAHYGFPVIQNHFELILWPISLVFFMWPHAITLLVLQNMATFGVELVVFIWAWEILAEFHMLETKLKSHVASALLALSLVANPWIYEASFFDFHLQAFATFFLLLAARFLHRGRYLYMALALGGVLSCGDVASSYILGLGLSAILIVKEHKFIISSALVSLGLLWLGVVGAFGATKSTNFFYLYGYLAPNVQLSGGVSGLVQLVAGIARHPSKILFVLKGRSSYVFDFASSAGGIGIGYPMALGVAGFVFLANILPQTGDFIAPFAAFQNLPAIAFIEVGTAWVLGWLYSYGSVGSKTLMGVLSLLAFLLAARVDLIRDPALLYPAQSVSNGASLALWRSVSKIPATSEVIGSEAVLGNFANRRFVYPFFATHPSQSFPVFESTVYFVLAPGMANGLGTPSNYAIAERTLTGKLHARRIIHSFDVTVYEYHPDSAVRSVVI